MAKIDFRVTSIFKVINKICMKNVDFCGKTSKFLPKRCLFIFCIKKKEKFSLVKLVSSYHKLSILPLAVRP